MNPPVIAYFMMPGPVELGIVALVILLLFGSRLPNVMRNVGQSIVEFKKGVKGVDQDEEQTGQDADAKEGR